MRCSQYWYTCQPTCRLADPQPNPRGSGRQQNACSAKTRAKVGRGMTGAERLWEGVALEAMACIRSYPSFSLPPFLRLALGLRRPTAGHKTYAGAKRFKSSFPVKASQSTAPFLPRPPVCWLQRACFWHNCTSGRKKHRIGLPLISQKLKSKTEKKTSKMAI